MACATQPITIASPSTRAKELALSARKLLEDLKQLEVGMSPESSDCQPCPRRTSSITLSSPIRRSHPRRGSPAPRHQTLSSCQSPVNHPTSSTVLQEGLGKKRVSGEFVDFCDHLLYMNHVWKQEQQLRQLRSSIKALEKAKSSNAFKSFCDRLLLQNRVWQLERQVRDLTAEGERNKRARLAAITRAAQQMAVDVRKEGMIEEFVMELVQELKDSREAMFELKEEHEREIREVQGDWLKEHRRLARENEQLRLERHARLLEQEMSNDFEQSLSEEVERNRQRIRELEDTDGDSTLVGDAFDHGSVLFSGSSSSVDEAEMAKLDFDEEMSTMSSATCVSLQERPNWSKKAAAARRQRHSMVPGSTTMDGSITKKRVSRRQSMPLRKLDTAPYAGFSFNPLFFGNPETLVVSPSRANDSETPMKVTLKIAPPSAPSVRPRTGSMTKSFRSVGLTGSRGPWRF